MFVLGVSKIKPMSCTITIRWASPAPPSRAETAQSDQNSRGAEVFIALATLALLNSALPYFTLVIQYNILYDTFVYHTISCDIMI